MSKLIYKPTKMYQDNINDLVKTDVEKGGFGSGRKKVIDNTGSIPKGPRAIPKHIAREMEEALSRIPQNKIPQSKKNK